MKEPIGYIAIKGDEVYGGALDGAKVCWSKRITKNIVWWGWQQKHKWRWNVTHIDLGCVSIYELKAKRFWRFVSILIWPLRKYYHWRYCSSLAGCLNESIR